MKDAKFILGYVKNGSILVTDEFGTGTHQHRAVEKLGGQSDVTVLGGKEEGNITTIEFSIPLISTDSKGRKIDSHAMTTVLLAYGPNIDSFFIKHKFRTRLSVNLSTGKYNQ